MILKTITCFISHQRKSLTLNWLSPLQKPTRSTNKQFSFDSFLDWVGRHWVFNMFSSPLTPQHPTLLLGAALLCLLSLVSRTPTTTVAPGEDAKPDGSPKTTSEEKVLLSFLNWNMPMRSCDGGFPSGCHWQCH